MSVGARSAVAMADAAVLLETRGAVATLTFNRPARMNALSAELFDAALDALARVRADASIRALVIAARGKAFCAGADLADLEAQRAAGAALGDRVAELMDTGGAAFVKALRALPVPVLCAVQGAVAGGGVGIALAADIVIAARSACFILPFVPSLGLVPDMGAAWFMQRAIGGPWSIALTLLGDRLSAEQAAQQGLIWRCVDDDRLPDEVARVADRLAALPAHGILEARALFEAAARLTLAEQLDRERDRQRELIERDCFAEGLAAFFGKRQPVFEGRNGA